MDQITAFVEIAACAALVAAPAIAIVRILDGGLGIGAAFVRSSVPAWPRGIQEEEPRPWSLPPLVGGAESAA
ncbi:MAG TPA: hypothetical protein VFS32_13020 [Candidatus Limnocylindrales bacterium]|nr:hypothetical protein [Candidatus Limnocylindrales bacterium]